MSCGNRFQCGLNKSSRFQFKPDKPSNPELYNENQKRLNDLLKAREEIDKQYITSTSIPQKALDITNIDYNIPINNLIITDTSTYTPWTIPLSHNYKTNPK